MSWSTRLLSDTALAPYVTPAAGTGLPARVAALLAQQHETWPMLRAGTVALAAAQYRSLQVNGSEVLAQYNPQRLVSTAAPVDATSIRARRCFLCAEYLPLEERGLAWGDDLVILCNPFPVLPNHLVISARSHTPQAIAGSYGTLLDLAAILPLRTLVKAVRSAVRKKFTASSSAIRCSSSWSSSAVVAGRPAGTLSSRAGTVASD